mmetsp:Transcript_27857/g.57031  ORF Transcript_27857/g.57031 Transcript_27857/m.57031 type:complete len:202 (+) Transcript_27857:69-674(+)
MQFLKAQSQKLVEEHRLSFRSAFRSAKHLRTKAAFVDHSCLVLCHTCRTLSKPDLLLFEISTDGSGCPIFIILLHSRVHLTPHLPQLPSELNEREAGVRSLHLLTNSIGEKYERRGRLLGTAVRDFFLPPAALSSRFRHPFSGLHTRRRGVSCHHWRIGMVLLRMILLRITRRPRRVSRGRGKRPHILTSCTRFQNIPDKV